QVITHDLHDPGLVVHNEDRPHHAHPVAQGRRRRGAAPPSSAHTVPAPPLDSWDRRCHSSNRGGTPFPPGPPQAYPRQNSPRARANARNTNRIGHTNPKNPKPNGPW